MTHEPDFNLPKKVKRHITPVEEVQEQGTSYVNMIQEMYSSPEVQNYLPLAPELVGDKPSVSDTSGVVVAPAQTPSGATEPGQEQPGRVEWQPAPGSPPESPVGAYRVVSEGPPEMAVYIPLVSNALENTQGKRMVPVRAPDQSDVQEFARFISGAYRAYIRDGHLYPEAISSLSGLSVEKVGFYLRQEETNHALAVRGVSTEIHLTPEQDYAISILGDTSSKLNWNERMRRAGLSNAKLMAWRKNPVFDQALKGLSEQVTANHDVALFELGRKVGEGDMRAIEKSLEISGRYNPAQQSTVDALVLINRVMEVLSNHLSDHPEILMAVAKDLAEARQETRQIESTNNKTIFGLG